MKKLRVAYNAAAKTAEILIYGPIGASFWDDSGITAKDFTDALNEIPHGTTITIGINSQGGAIGEGLAIHNAIKRRAGEITARIDGYALSAGSFIPLAAGKVISPDSAIWMIHKGWSFAQGNADEMRKTADLLDTHDATLIDIYAARTGKSRADIEAALADETWMTGAEAVAYGLADESGGDTDKNAMAAVDLTKGQFKNPRAFQTILAGLTGQRNQKGTTPGVTTATLSAPIVSAAVVTQNQPANSGAQPKANMNKSKIVALLKKHGIEASETETDEQLLAKLEGIPTDASTSKIVAAIESLKASINPVVAAPAAAAPLAAAPRIEVIGNTAIEKFDAFGRNDHTARANFVRENHLDLRTASIAARKGDLGLPLAANTVDANLVNTLIAGDFLTTMRTKMAPLAAFSRNVSVSPVSARQVLQVNLLSSAGATQDNPTNFETGDTTSTARPVTLAHTSRSFHTTNAEQDLGLALAQKAPTNALIFAEGIMAKVTALMTNANFGADVVIGAAADFSSTDLPAILALGKNYDKTTLLLDGGHLAYLLPTSRESFTFGEAGAYGFDGGIYKNNLWTSAATDIAGLVCGPDAIIWAGGPVANGPSGSGLAVSNIVIPEIGLSVQAHTWFALGSRAMWASYDVCFGCAVGDATQAEVLTTQ